MSASLEWARSELARLVVAARRNARGRRWFAGECLVCGLHPRPEVHGHGFYCTYNEVAQ